MKTEDLFYGLERDGRPGWDMTYMSICYTFGQRSRDKSTKVGCVITDSDHVVLSMGYNSFVRGHNDDGEIMADGMPKYHSRIDGEKYYWTEHGERNAIYNAARKGVSLVDSTLYITWLPCMDCARAIRQAGVREVVIHRHGQAAFLHSRGGFDQTTTEKWTADHERTIKLFDMTGVEYRWYEGFLIPGTTAYFSGKEYEFHKDGFTCKSSGQRFVMNSNKEYEIQQVNHD